MSLAIPTKLPSILCAIAMGAMIGGRVSYQVGPYLAGRWGTDPISNSFEFGAMALFGLCLGVGFLAAIVLAGLFSYRMLLVPAPKKKALVEALVIGALIASTFWLCRWRVQPENQYFLDGFQTCMARNANLAKIQQWARTVNDRDGLVSETDWPPFVSDFGPSFVSVEIGDGKREVSITWGGGFFHWGLTLADTRVGTAFKAGKRVQVLDDFSYVWVDSQ